MTANDGICSVAERARNQAAEVEALYGEVLQQFPEHVHALRGLADVYVLRGLVDAVERQGVDSDEWPVIEAAIKAHAGNFVEAAKSFLAQSFSDKFEKMLECGLAYDPGNTALLWRCGEIYRSVGDFTAALDAYRRILALDPENQAAVYAYRMLAGKAARPRSLDRAGEHWARAEAHRAEGNLDATIDAYRDLLEDNPDHTAARYICAVLTGDGPVAAPPDYMPRPVPFAVIDNFLPAEMHEALLRLTYDLRDSFKPSTIGYDGEKNLDIRKSRLVSRIKDEKLVHWFEQRITDAVTEIRPALHIDAFEYGAIELQITAHHENDFYGEHDDVGEKGSNTERRRVSAVYYYHWLPKAFECGDLLLHDLNRNTEPGYTRLAPIDNSIVFFPSEYSHEVTPVHCRGNDFRSGRFTLNGWVNHGE